MLRLNLRQRVLRLLLNNSVKEISDAGTPDGVPKFLCKKLKKLLTKRKQCDRILNVAAENSNNMNLENERLNSV